MSTDTVSWTVHRARVARAAQTGADDTQARRDLALARVEERIRVAVEAAPPLPEALQSRLVELIRSAPAVPDAER